MLTEYFEQTLKIDIRSFLCEFVFVSLIRRFTIIPSQLEFDIRLIKKNE